MKRLKTAGFAGAFWLHVHNDLQTLPLAISYSGDISKILYLEIFSLRFLSRIQEIGLLSLQLLQKLFKMSLKIGILYETAPALK